MKKWRSVSYQWTNTTEMQEGFGNGSFGTFLALFYQPLLSLHCSPSWLKLTFFFILENFWKRNQEASNVWKLCTIKRKKNYWKQKSTEGKYSTNSNRFWDNVKFFIKNFFVPNLQNVFFALINLQCFCISGKLRQRSRHLNNGKKPIAVQK